VLSNTFRPKSDEIAGGWRKLHNVEFHNVYSAPDLIGITKLRRVIWAGHVGRMGKKNAYRVLVRKPEGKRPLERMRRR
jgi:hypothetical protein